MQYRTVLYITLQYSTVQDLRILFSKTSQTQHQTPQTPNTNSTCMPLVKSNKEQHPSSVHLEIAWKETGRRCGIPASHPSSIFLPFRVVLRCQMPNASMTSNDCNTRSCSPAKRSGSATSPLPMTQEKRSNDGEGKRTESSLNYMNDLTPPQLNLKRESILFSPSPST